MTDQPKRRGRPPGSPNRPKTITMPRWTPDDPTQMAIIPSGPIEFHDQTTVRVVLTRQQAWGDPVEEQVVDWPAHWRLPMLGEAVQFEPGWGGIVQTIDFDLQRGVPIIRVR